MLSFFNFLYSSHSKSVGLFRAGRECRKHLKTPFGQVNHISKEVQSCFWIRTAPIICSCSPKNHELGDKVEKITLCLARTACRVSSAVRKLQVSTPQMLHTRTSHFPHTSNIQVAFSSLISSHCLNLKLKDCSRYFRTTVEEKSIM